MEFKPAFNGKEVLWLWPYLLRVIVGGDDDPLRTDLDAGSFGLCAEGVMICPLFNVVCINLLGAQFLYDDGFLAVIAIPPYIVALDVGIWVSCPYRPGLACTGSSIVPLVGEDVEIVEGVLHDLEQVYTLLDLFQLFDWDQALFYGQDYSVLDNKLVAGCCVALDVLGCGGDAVLESGLSLIPGIFFAAVPPCC